MKVLYLLNIPSPNRVNYFNELGKMCELTVLFETEASTERDESWKHYKFDNFRGIVMPGVRTSLDTAFCPSVIKYLKKDKYDYVIVANLASPTGLFAVAWLRMKQVSYCYEGDGGIAGNAKGIKAMLKRFIISSADICFSTTDAFDQYCMTYGAKREKIRRYPFSSIYESNVLERVLKEHDKAELKKQLGIRENKVILSVGRVIHLKGFDLLLDAFAGINNPDWGLYIVGGIVNKEFQTIILQKGIKNVYFIDFILPDELRKYYEAADIFVLPTRYDPWGLVVNEAMAAGLPVITTFACGAGTEMVRPNETGYLYEAERTDELRGHLLTLMNCDELRERMGTEALNTVHGYTLEKMAEAHIHILEREKSNEKTKT